MEGASVRELTLSWRPRLQQGFLLRPSFPPPKVICRHSRGFLVFDVLVKHATFSLSLSLSLSLSVSPILVDTIPHTYSNNFEATFLPIPHSSSIPLSSPHPLRPSILLPLFDSPNCLQQGPPVPHSTQPPQERLLRPLPPHDSPVPSLGVRIPVPPHLNACPLPPSPSHSSLDHQADEKPRTGF